MNAILFGKRRAISPVLATVILIAITMISGVSMAGFSFGLFSTLSATANVTAVGATCVAGSATASACMVSLRNTGDAPSAVQACSLSGATSIASGSATVPSGQVASATCTGSPADTVPGQTVQGTFSLSNGITVPFTGIYV
jgi:flagellin-like protein